MKLKRCAAWLVAALAVVRPAFSEEDANRVLLTNQQVLAILDQVESDLKSTYYDRTFHGVDLTARFREARAKIAAAPSQDAAFLEVASAVDSLHDSHTRFLPPNRLNHAEYGFQMQAIGDEDCYVTHVKQGSDAEAKGLKPGDRIVRLNTLHLTRRNITTVETAYRIYPQAGFNLTVQSPEGTERQVVAMAKILPGRPLITSDVFTAERLLHHPQGWRDWEKFYRLESRFKEFPGHALVWKMPSFGVPPEELDNESRKARSYPALILDLRGNSGGRDDSLRDFLSRFFDHGFTAGERKTRSASNPLKIKGSGSGAVDARLIVLVDSQSASAAEIFARAVQLQKRGIVLGDRTPGMVMGSETQMHSIAANAQVNIFYALNITVMDLVMSDGNRLEGTGVMPDERILPTPADLAAGRDPVLTRALALAGVTIDPKEASEIFPFEWPPSKPFAE